MTSYRHGTGKGTKLTSAANRLYAIILWISLFLLAERPYNLLAYQLIRPVSLGQSRGDEKTPDDQQRALRYT